MTTEGSEIEVSGDNFAVRRNSDVAVWLADRKLMPVASSDAAIIFAVPFGATSGALTVVVDGATASPTTLWLVDGFEFVGEQKYTLGRDAYVAFPNEKFQASVSYQFVLPEGNPAALGTPPRHAISVSPPATIDDDGLISVGPSTGFVAISASLGLLELEPTDISVESCPKGSYYVSTLTRDLGREEYTYRPIEFNDNPARNSIAFKTPFLDLLDATKNTIHQYSTGERGSLARLARTIKLAKEEPFAAESYLLPRDDRFVVTAKNASQSYVFSQAGELLYNALPGAGKTVGFGGLLYALYPFYSGGSNDYGYKVFAEPADQKEAYDFGRFSSIGVDTAGVVYLKWGTEIRHVDDYAKRLLSERDAAYLRALQLERQGACNYCFSNSSDGIAEYCGGSTGWPDYYALNCEYFRTLQEYVRLRTLFEEHLPLFEVKASTPHFVVTGDPEAGGAFYFSNLHDVTRVTKGAGGKWVESTIVGTDSLEVEPKDGVGFDSAFKAANQITIDASGSLYLTDGPYLRRVSACP